MFKRLYNWFMCLPSVAQDIDARIKKALEKAKKDSLRQDLAFIQSMQKLEIKDGDIVVIKHPMSLSPAVRKRMAACLQPTIKDFGFNIHVVVLDEGMDIGVLTRDVPGTHKLQVREYPGCNLWRE